MRTRPSAMPAAASSADESCRWVVEGGWTAMVKTLPREAVRCGTVRASMKAAACSRDPRSRAIMPPPARNSRPATAAWGWLGRPG